MVVVNLTKIHSMHLWKSQAIKSRKMQKMVSIFMYKLPERIYWLLMTAEEGKSLSIVQGSTDMLYKTQWMTVWHPPWPMLRHSSVYKKKDWWREFGRVPWTEWKPGNARGGKWWVDMIKIYCVPVWYSFFNFFLVY